MERIGYAISARLHITLKKSEDTDLYIIIQTANKLHQDCQTQGLRGAIVMARDLEMRNKILLEAKNNQ